jgi:hypothetical protein
VPDTVAPAKPVVRPGGLYRVIANWFTWVFEEGGRRTVNRGDQIHLTSAEATALMAGPVLVQGPTPGTEIPPEV